MLDILLTKILTHLCAAALIYRDNSMQTCCREKSAAYVTSPLGFSPLVVATCNKRTSQSVNTLVHDWSVILPRNKHDAKLSYAKVCAPALSVRDCIARCNGRVQQTQ